MQNTVSRNILFTFLYLSEGAPIGFIWWALPTLLRKQNIPIEDITSLTAILVLPWTFKFLWAPLVDTLRNKNWGYKNWIISSQILMGITLIPLIFIEPQNNFILFAAILLLHSLFASTQDVSIDALAINYISKFERGNINGFMQAGMLIGRSLFGGGALLVVSFLGWKWIFIFLILTIWLSLILVLFVDEQKQNFDKSIHTFKSKLVKAFSIKNTWFGILFALTAAAAFEAVGGMAGPFLIDNKISQETIGFFFFIPVVAAAIVGGLIGGRLSDKIGRKKSIFLFTIGFIIPILIIGAADLNFNLRNEELFLISMLTIMYFFIGFFTAASYALFMDLTDPALGATQFSTFMAATNACEAWAVWFGGLMAGTFSYGISFISVSLVSLLSLLILWQIKIQNSEGKQLALPSF